MTRKLERREFLGLAAAAPLLLGDLSSAQRTAATANRVAQRFGIGHNLTTYISGGRGPDGFWKGVEEVAKLGVRATEADNTEIDAVKHNLDYITKTLSLKLGQPSAKSAR